MTNDQLKQLNIDPKWLEPLNNAFEKYDINTPRRQAAFLGQCMAESNHFTHIAEDLSYSAKRALQIFPNKFQNVDVNDYAMNPIKFANHVYAGIIGNGDEASGDGYKFHGRGIIQLTGRNNYKACGKALGMDLEANPDYVATPEGAVESAALFFKMNNLNKYADDWDLDSLTKMVNHACLGLADRKMYSEQALKVLTA